jgi:hypothetical protein
MELEKEVEVAKRQKAEAQNREEVAKRQKAEAQAENYRQAALGAKKTTERWLREGVDVLATAFDQAPVVEFWLPLESLQNWSGVNWNEFVEVDRSKTETLVIQKRMSKSKLLDSSPYELVDTHNGWNRLTQDATLFIKGVPHSELSTAVLIEWVGQDTVGFPDKEHKSKLLRDGLRLYQRCGGQREVHMAISDLSRVVAVRITNVRDDGTPVVEKTAVRSGGTVVRDILNAYSSATPSQLSVTIKCWEFLEGGSATRPKYSKVYASRVLGGGLHGQVFGTQDQTFVKEERKLEECIAETQALRKLNANAVRYVPILHTISKSKMAFRASPVGSPARQLQGLARAWSIGAQLVTCLHETHTKALLCHRDVRPDNVVFLDEGKENEQVCIAFLCIAFLLIMSL